MSPGASLVATSVTEAEIYGMSEGAKCGVRFYHLLKSIMPFLAPFLYGKKLTMPMKLHADNQGGVKFAAQTQLQGRLKHVDIRRAAIRDYVQRLMCQICWCESKKNKSNGLTKPTTGQDLLLSRAQLGILDL